MVRHRHLYKVTIYTQALAFGVILLREERGKGAGGPLLRTYSILLRDSVGEMFSTVSNR